MRYYLIVVLLFFQVLAMGQACLIHDDYNSREVILKNQVKQADVYEYEEENKRLSERFIYDNNGCPSEHWYFDPYAGDSLPVIEKHILDVELPGLVQYTRGRYNLSGKMKEMYQSQISFYTKSGKLYQREWKEYIDFEKTVIDKFDTADYEKLDKTEMVKLKEGDTLRMVIDFYDKLTRIQMVKTKKNGVWEETEKCITTFLKGELDYFVCYRNGKFSHDYDPKKEKENQSYGHIEKEYGLPVPDHVADTIYTLKMDYNEKGILPKKSKYILIRHYEQGISNGLSWYAFYNYQTKLLLMRSQPDGRNKTEINYLFR